MIHKKLLTKLIGIVLLALITGFIVLPTEAQKKILPSLANSKYLKDQNNLQEIILNPGDKIDVTPPIIHRAEALEDSEIFEVSTPELDDVVKLDDDYGRKGKGNDEKEDETLSKT